jgi:hypothetical protein
MHEIQVVLLNYLEDQAAVALTIRAINPEQVLQDKASQVAAHQHRQLLEAAQVHIQALVLHTQVVEVVEPAALENLQEITVPQAMAAQDA